MKTYIRLIILFFAVSMFSSCVVVTDGPPGPDGYPGRAFYGISYDDYRPYSYWDNNPDVPVKPYFDEYYPTVDGIYDFEYFVDRYDYWYGTYEIWTNPGEPGRPNGIAGRNGLDSYLLLVCNADGPYSVRKDMGGTVTKLANGAIQYEMKNPSGGIRVIMQKTTVQQRPAQTPKAVFK